jgi:hypothetical protein
VPVTQESWSVRELTEAAAKPQESDGALEIPRFQRHLVWDERRREQLIDSLFRGFPVGSLLVYRRATATGGVYYQLVDGLQRTSAIRRYQEEPLRYAPAGRLLPKEHLDWLLDLIGADTPSEETVEAVSEAFTSWMRETKELRGQAGFTAKKLASALNTSLSDGEGPPPIADEDVLWRLLDHVKEVVSLADVQVPISVFSGEQEDLPEIFERINTQGTKLTRYEIFAATWRGAETVIGNEKVRAKIENKYRDLMENGFAIEGLEKDQAITDFTLFEYLFGLGRVLSEDYPRLFRQLQSPADEEPAAFSLVTVALGHEVKDMRKLPSWMPRASDDQIDPSALEEALRESTKFIDGVLRPYIGLRLNETGSSPVIAHADYQIQSFIGRALAGAWEIGDDGVKRREGWEDDRDSLSRALPAHYLYDILRQAWRGNVAERFFRRVWAVDEDEGTVTGLSPYYLTPPSRDQWDDVLREWFEEQLSRQQRTRPRVRQVDKIFLKFVYTSRVTHFEDQAETFELEHLFPVARLKNLIPEESNGWPISCISNLALFTKALNRETSKNTIAEHLESLEARDPDEAAAIREMLDRYLFCEVDAVTIPNIDGDDSLTLEAYKKFLRERWEALTEHLFEFLEVPAG